MQSKLVVRVNRKKHIARTNCLAEKAFDSRFLASDGEPFFQVVLLMAARIVGVGTNDLKAETLVKPQRLEVVRIEHHLSASARRRLAFSREHQGFPVPAPAAIHP